MNIKLNLPKGNCDHPEKTSYKEEFLKSLKSNVERIKSSSQGFTQSIPAESIKAFYMPKAEVLEGMAVLRYTQPLKDGKEQVQIFRELETGKFVGFEENGYRLVKKGDKFIEYNDDGKNQQKTITDINGNVILSLHESERTPEEEAEHRKATDKVEKYNTDMGFNNP